MRQKVASSRAIAGMGVNPDEQMEMMFK